MSTRILCPECRRWIEGVLSTDGERVIARCPCGHIVTRLSDPDADEIPNP